LWFRAKGILGTYGLNIGGLDLYSVYSFYFVGCLSSISCSGSFYMSIFLVNFFLFVEQRSSMNSSGVSLLLL